MMITLILLELYLYSNKTVMQNIPTHLQTYIYIYKYMHMYHFYQSVCLYTHIA